MEVDGNPDTFGEKFGLDKTLNLCYDNEKIKIKREREENRRKNRGSVEPRLVSGTETVYNNP